MLRAELIPRERTRDKLYSGVQQSDVIRFGAGGGIQESIALVKIAMSVRTLIIKGIVFTDITNESFGGFRSLFDQLSHLQ